MAKSSLPFMLFRIPGLLDQSGRTSDSRYSRPALPSLFPSSPSQMPAQMPVLPRAEAPAPSPATLLPAQPREFPALPDVATRALQGPPVQPQPSDLPRVNEFGKWLKQAPIAGAAWGGIADYLSNVGTPKLSLQNANAAAWDLMPLGAAFKTPKVINAVGSLTPVQQGIYGGLGDIMIPNPFEQPDPNRSVLNRR